MLTKGPNENAALLHTLLKAIQELNSDDVADPPSFLAKRHAMQCPARQSVLTTVIASAADKARKCRRCSVVKYVMACSLDDL
jgi:hypothetical protein